MDQVNGIAGGRVSRRLFLGVVAAGFLAPLGRPNERDHAARGLIARQRNPDNLEFPFWTLDSFLVPNNQFFVRSHFVAPTLDAGKWKLKVEGAVKEPLEVGYDDLVKMPSHTLPALL